MPKLIGKDFFLKMWENYPSMWKSLINVGVFLKYKTLNTSKLPNEILLASSNRIFVNANENRGKALLIHNGVTQKRLTRFWTNMVREYAPDLAIDVGVNYGECVFSTNSPSHTKVYGLEANQQLMKYIEQSKAVHPNDEQIKIVNAFAADKAEEKTFYLDQHWSGTSSAAYRPSHDMIEKTTVQSVTIDSIVEEDMTDKKVLFKVDVEGYEAFVLKGMTELMKKSSSVIGFIEFNSVYIEKSGVDVSEFFRFIQQHFSVYIYHKNKLIQIEQMTLVELQRSVGSDYIHTDMVLVKDVEPNNRLIRSFLQEQ